jgi:hypothetical protein
MNTSKFVSTNISTKFIKIIVTLIMGLLVVPAYLYYYYILAFMAWRISWIFIIGFPILLFIIIRVFIKIWKADENRKTFLLSIIPVAIILLFTINFLLFPPSEVCSNRYPELDKDCFGQGQAYICSDKKGFQCR